jgi:voltage-gated potassium channel
MSTDGLGNHLIVCGGGITAEHIVEELEGAFSASPRPGGTGVVARPYIVIDQDPAVEERLGARFDRFRFLCGDATDDEVILAAGVETAHGLFAVLPSDKDNLFVTVTARQMNPCIRVVSRTEDVFHTGRKLSGAGAGAVVPPNFIGGLRLVSELCRPNVTAFLDEMLRSRESGIELRELAVPAESPVIGQPLEALDLHVRLRLNVVAVVDPGQNAYRYNPPADFAPTAGTVLVLFGRRDRIDAFAAELAAAETPEETAE